MGSEFTQQRNIGKIKQIAANGLKAISSESITVDNTVKTLSAAKLALEPKAIHVYLTSSITSRAIRYTYDGSTPASGTGIGVFDDGEFLLEEAENLDKFRVIQEGAGTHTIFVTYLK